ncbi:glycosyl transferase [Paenibacillus sp. CAA11]|nr:glycosyl transferase [Paenibacillus sp. CAA11]
MRLTDDTGLLEHALGSIPRRNEGYTTDDNARGLWACSVIHKIAGKDGGQWLRLAENYLAFLLWVQREDGSFHNNIAYDRSPETEIASDDCFGRTCWAAANALVLLPSEGSRLAAEQILLKAANQTDQLRFPRGIAYALSAYAFLLTHEEFSSVWLDRNSLLSKLKAIEWVSRFEQQLLNWYGQASSPDWCWFEEKLTYGNGLLPWALFNAYQVTGNAEAFRVARESMDFLASKMTAPEGWIRPIGNERWATAEHMSQWDQQPLEVFKLALAAREAYRLEKREEDAQLIGRCRDWFYGENDCRRALADAEDGSCCDGLTLTGPNLNRGAESTLSYLLTEYLYIDLELGPRAQDS